jgi:predicted component of type VI protein secretion system
MNSEQKMIVADLLQAGLKESKEMQKDINDHSQEATDYVVFSILRHTKENQYDNPLLRERKKFARAIHKCLEGYEQRLEWLRDILFSGSETEIEESLGKDSGKYKD